MRGRRYSIDGEQNIASPADTCLGLTSTTAIEPMIGLISVGCEDVPADASIVWYLQRSTAAGTNTSVTPQNLGPGTVAATASAGENHTAEPTYTSNAILWRLALNQRATHTIVFDPDGYIGLPATANNGVGLYPSHASSTVLVSATMHFQE
jgi:hypothetical protein